MRKAFVLLHIAVLLAGFTGVFGKLIELNEVFITFYRMLFSGLMLLIIALLFSRKTFSISTKDVIKIGSAGFILALHWIFFYGSIKYSNISVGVVCFCLTSFFTSILSPIINKKKASPIEIGLSLLTLIGIGLIFSFDVQYRFGIFLGVISSFMIAVFTIINEKLTKQFEVIQLTTFQMIGGTIGLGLLLPFILRWYPTDYMIPTMSDFLYLLILSGICTILMYILINIALRSISAFTINLSFNLEPIYSIVIAVLFFQEYKELNFGFYLGLTLIMLSLVFQMFRMFQQNKRAKWEDPRSLFSEQGSHPKNN